MVGFEAPLNFLKDSNASPKMKTTKKGIRVSTLTHNTLGVKGALELRDGD
jgi:hypothetical protein